MNRVALVIAAFAVLVTGGCRDAGKSIGFYYNDKPINPMCFMQGTTLAGYDDIPLSLCSGNNQLVQDTVFKPDGRLQITPEGAIGYNFQCDGNCMFTPYIYYKDLGEVDGDRILQIDQSSGGGNFSDVRRVRIYGNILRTKTIMAGGDRCNGGISDAWVSGASVFYNVNMTPFDVLTQSEGNQAGFQAYADLPSCATCCLATANYENSVLKSVSLKQDPKDIDPTNMSPVEVCFYTAYTEVYKKGVNGTLSIPQLREFGKAFNERCGPLKR